MLRIIDPVVPNESLSSGAETRWIALEMRKVAIVIDIAMEKTIQTNHGMR